MKSSLGYVAGRSAFIGSLILFILSYQNCAPVHEELNSSSNFSSIHSDPIPSEIKNDIFDRYGCTGCHADKMANIGALVRGGWVKFGDPQGSQLIQRTCYHPDAAGLCAPTGAVMPPGGSTLVSAEHMATLVDWIKCPTDGCTGLTYTKSIKPILETHCTSCHSSSLSEGGVNLETYQNVLSFVDTIGFVPEFSALYTSVRNDNMPKNMPALSDSDKNMIRDWITDQAPE